MFATLLVTQAAIIATSVYLHRDWRTAPLAAPDCRLDLHPLISTGQNRREGWRCTSTTLTRRATRTAR
jgi:hypothetical protein